MFNYMPYQYFPGVRVEYDYNGLHIDVVDLERDIGDPFDCHKEYKYGILVLVQCENIVCELSGIIERKRSVCIGCEHNLSWTG